MEFQDDLDRVANVLPPGKGRTLAIKEARGLVRYGVDSFPSLLSLIEDDGAPTHQRSMACWFAGRLRRKRAARSLLIALRNGDRSLTMQAASSLGLLKAKLSVRPLIHDLVSAPRPDRRAASAYALGWIGDQRALNPLIRVIGDKEENTDVRSHAAEALAYLRGRQACKPLIRALADSTPEIRFWAAFALGQIRCRAALPFLRRLAASDRTRVAGWWTVSREARDAIEAVETGCISGNPRNRNKNRP